MEPQLSQSHVTLVLHRMRRPPTVPIDNSQSASTAPNGAPPKQRIVRKQLGFECYGFNKFNIINFTTFNMHRSIENEHCYTGTGLWVMYVGTFH